MNNLKEKILNFDFWNWFSQNRFIIILLVVLVFVGYFNSLDNAFVSDDIAAIPDNQNLDSFSYVLTNPRALARNLLYYSVNKIWGLNPAAYRLFGILCHLGTVLASFLLISILAEPLTAAIAASLFSVHPILIEGTAWISGGIYAQYSFFIILAVLFYLFSIKSNKFYFLSLASLIMALLSSEKAVVFPLILLAFFLLLREVLGSWKKLILPFVVSSSWALFYLLAIPGRIQTLQQQNPQPASSLNPFLQIPLAIGSYLKLIFWPDKLTLYHSEMFFSTGQYLVSLLVLAMILTGIFVSFRKKSLIFFWLSLFLISLLPTLTPLGISWVVAERYVYLGTLGVIAVFAFFLKSLAEKQSLRTAVLIFCALLTASLLARTVIRNNDWQNQDTLWLAAARTSPSSSQNHNNLGDLYGRQGNYTKAVEEFKKAIELNPNYADAFHNLANTYVQINETDLAIENYKKALEFNPYLWQSYENLGVVYYQRKQLNLAGQYLGKAVEINPRNASLHFNLGIVYAENNEKEKAEAEFQKAFDIDPELRKNIPAP